MQKVLRYRILREKAWARSFKSHDGHRSSFVHYSDDTTAFQFSRELYATTGTRFSRVATSRRLYERELFESTKLPSNVREVDHYESGGLVEWEGIKFNRRSHLRIFDYCDCCESIPGTPGEPNYNSQRASENYPEPENRVVERVVLIVTGTQKLPYFQYKITV
ncbi:hypothetical protein TNCV_1875021 [Trichonephila clavipes]|nr:hypothetical protein TNCV_1875021 [Trichonephila clavipes]